MAFDFVFPNKQLVECYIVFAEMDAAKRNEDPDAQVCPHLSNHGDTAGQIHCHFVY